MDRSLPPLTHLDLDLKKATKSIYFVNPAKRFSPPFEASQQQSPTRLDIDLI